MNRLFKPFFLSIIFFTFVYSQESINAIKVPGNVSKIGPSSKAWLSAEYTDIVLYPHQLIRKTDLQDDSQAFEKEPKKVQVKALYDGKNISLLLRWSDDTKNSKQRCCPREYEDGFALQFPRDYNDVAKLPYISMGNSGRQVVLHLKKAMQTRDLQDSGYFELFHPSVSAHTQEHVGKTFLAEGWQSAKEIKKNKNPIRMEMVYSDGVWKGSLSRPLADGQLDINSGAFPVSFVTWDGSSENADGTEYISSWTGVKLAGKQGGQDLIEALKKVPNGDPANGKKLAMENCAACHNFDDAIMAPEYMAPNLSNIGGYTTAQYLLESILDPSAVIVPMPDRVIDASLPWYNVEGKGQTVSTMPSYKWMDEASRDDLLAYFSSLKGE